MKNLYEKRRAFCTEIRRKHHQSYREKIRQSLVKENQKEFHMQAFNSIQVIYNDSSWSNVQNHLGIIFRHICQNEVNRDYILRELLEQGIIGILFKKYDNFILPLLDRLLVGNNSEELAKLTAQEQDFVGMIAQKISSLSKQQIHLFGLPYVKIFNVFGNYVKKLPQSIIESLTQNIVLFPFIDPADQKQQLKFYINITRIADQSKDSITKTEKSPFSQKILKLIQLYENPEQNWPQQIGQEDLYYLSISVKFQYNEHFYLIQHLLRRFYGVLKLKFINHMASEQIWFQFRTFELDVHLMPLFNEFLLSEQTQKQKEQIICIQIVNNMIINNEFDDQITEQIIKIFPFHHLVYFSCKKDLKQEISHLLVSLNSYFKNVPLQNQEDYVSLPEFQGYLKTYLKALKIISKYDLPLQQEVQNMLEYFQMELNQQISCIQAQQNGYQLQMIRRAQSISEGSSLDVNHDAQYEDNDYFGENQNTSKVYIDTNNPQSAEKQRSDVRINRTMDQQRQQR